ncbi:hypothetical protein [Ancylobacter sp. IITR112]|uniref:hypothetical protein n=1 Tax=Ancylobacter sp. IITR112 TaxID=3138073 RepID=UPI00352A0981
MSDAPELLRAWAPPGPVSQAFALDFSSLVKGIMGPVGGGKTTTCIFASQAFAASMPTCMDGVVRSKGVVVRDSFRTLEKTTLASWFTWFPKDHPSWTFTGGNDRPAVHTLRFHLPGERILESITEFVGIGAARVEDILRGWEGSWGWPNEADLMAPDVLDYLTQRIRRYPSKRMLPPGIDPPGQILMDFNAPDIDNYLHDRLVENKPEGWAFYPQPGGLDPGAENLQNLPSDYYQRVMQGKPDWWVRRFIHNKWGYSRSGTPVYPEFNENLHVAKKELVPDPRLPIKIALDAGGHPSAAILQPMPNGQLRMTDELYLGQGVGPTRFARALVALVLERYPNCPLLPGVCDPSAIHGADREEGEMSWNEIVGQALGIPIMPAASNDIGLRTDGVRQQLTTLIDGHLPAFIVSPRCKWAVRGFAYGYRFVRIGANPQANFRTLPEKNEFSNVHDAIQYGVMDVVGLHGIITKAAGAGRARVRDDRAPSTQRPGDFDVFAV